jgi:uncharacterized membrane protein
MRKIMALEWITIMLTSLVMGVLWGTWFALSRTIDRASPEVFLGIGKMTIHNLALSMPILMPLTILSIIVLLFVAVKRKFAYWWLVALALVCMIGVIISTLAIAVPIDNHIKVWTVQTLPADWMRQRDNWQIAHTIRTFLSIGAVATLAAYTIGRKSQDRIK